MTKIVIQIQRGKFRAQLCRSTSEGYQPLYTDGEELNPWREDSCETMLKNLQVSRTKTICKMAVFSDVSLHPDLLPQFEHTEAWTWDELGKLVAEQKISASQWIVNGSELPCLQRFFPLTSGKGIGYIMTTPQLTVPTTVESDPNIYHIMQRIGTLPNP